MLFNSVHFLFFFLPVALGLFFLVGHYSARAGKATLAALSLLFYAYWDYRFLPLLAFSIAVNYGFGLRLAARCEQSGFLTNRKLLFCGVAFNLLLLAFFKYANFFVVTIEGVLDSSFNWVHIVLPIGISFYTFTQIAFLVDVYQKKASESDFYDYVLFVSYFPHQIAGPILHHKEMMSQFREMVKVRASLNNIIVGLSVLSIGIVKKVLIADTVSDYASPIFSAAEGGGSLLFFEAWFGVLAYAVQLYFDFSGYCDMAIGISLMFGIRLPINFNSPYKAVNMIDFWRRWHMTLSRFLRDYLYISLGGNRSGEGRRYVNLLITMALGGFWHGASWNFLIWGFLHGLYLVVNHLFREIRRRVFGMAQGTRVWAMFSWVLTFSCVLIAWVFFRAESFHGAIRLVKVMLGSEGVTLPLHIGKYLQGHEFLRFSNDWLGSIGMLNAAILILCLLVCIAFPNTQNLFEKYSPALLPSDYSGGKKEVGLHFMWKPSLLWSALLAFGLAVSISRLGNESQFLYFNF